MVVQTKNINRRRQPNLYTSEGSPQIISIVGDGPIIYIHIGGLSINKQIKIRILIQGLGECEGVGEDSGMS